MSRPKFKRGEIVSGPGFGWYKVEGVNVEKDGYTYELRDVLSPELLKLGPAMPKHNVPEERIRNVFYATVAAREKWTGTAMEALAQLEPKLEELLAQGFDRLDEEGELPETVEAETEVVVSGVAFRVRVTLDAKSGEVMRFEAVY